MSVFNDHRLVLTLSGAMVVQTAMALIWAGGAAERLSQLESRIDQGNMLIERTARLEEQTDHIRHTLVRIEEKIDSVRGDL